MTEPVCSCEGCPGRDVLDGNQWAGYVTPPHGVPVVVDYDLAGEHAETVARLEADVAYWRASYEGAKTRENRLRAALEDLADRSNWGRTRDGEGYIFGADGDRPAHEFARAALADGER